MRARVALRTAYSSLLEGRFGEGHRGDGVIFGRLGPPLRLLGVHLSLLGLDVPANPGDVARPSVLYVTPPLLGPAGRLRCLGLKLVRLLLGGGARRGHLDLHVGARLVLGGGDPVFGDLCSLGKLGELVGCCHVPPLVRCVPTKSAHPGRPAGAKRDYFSVESVSRTGPRIRPASPADPTRTGRRAGTRESPGRVGRRGAVNGRNSPTPHVVPTLASVTRNRHAVTAVNATAKPARAASEPATSRRQASDRVEPVEVHHLDPRRDEVADELLPRVVARVDLGERAQLGVRPEDEVDPAAGPLDLAGGAVAALEGLAVLGRRPSTSCPGRAGSRRSRWSTTRASSVRTPSDDCLAFAPSTRRPPTRTVISGALRVSRFALSTQQELGRQPVALAEVVAEPVRGRLERGEGLHVGLLLRRVRRGPA